MEITPPDTTVGRDLVENVRNGNLDGMSIGFTVKSEGVVWDFKSTPAVRNLKEVGLVEVSVVAMPAYPDTSVALRSMPKRGRPAGEVKALLDAKIARWRK